MARETSTSRIWGTARVVEVTPAGVGSVVSMGSVTLSSPRGIALDPSGDIFIADTGNSRVVEVTAGGSAVALSITGLSSPSTLNTPKGLGTDVAGNLYIADSGNNRIVKSGGGRHSRDDTLDRAEQPQQRHHRWDWECLHRRYRQQPHRRARHRQPWYGAVYQFRDVEWAAWRLPSTMLFGVAYVADTGEQSRLDRKSTCLITT